MAHAAYYYPWTERIPGIHPIHFLPKRLSMAQISIQIQDKDWHLNENESEVGDDHADLSHHQMQEWR